MTTPEFKVRPLAQMDYTTAWREMRAFTDTRTEATPDEIWFLEHPAVYTLGQNGKREHILHEGDIPVLEVDRGGQVTYHGPGQLLVYVLLDLRRRNKSVRDLVTALERSTIALLASYGIAAQAKCEAPGVYVDAAKICSLGLRIRRGCSYHGLALNVAMDLAPFSRINPCGHRDLKMTQVSALGGPKELTQIAEDMLPLLAKYL